MTLHTGRWLPSDRICFRLGFDGYEPEQLLAIQEYADPAYTRASVAINTYYPEVQGGQYLNRNLFTLVQESLEECGLWLIDLEYHRPDGLVPVLPHGSLGDGESCGLVNADLDICGIIKVWDVWVAGHAAGDFYSEQTMIDVLIDKADSINIYKNMLFAKCRDYGVQCDEIPTVSMTPVKMQNGNWLKKMFT